MPHENLIRHHTRLSEARNLFYLRTLGGLHLQSDSEELPSSAHQRRRLTLLLLLARAGDLGISRDRLLALLWPEGDEEHARHALDQLLYLIRRDFGKHVISPQCGNLRIDRAVIRSDCVAFETHLQNRDWEAAVRLYGGPFLDGVHLGGSAELERWMDAERAELEQGYIRALEQLAGLAKERGDAPAAVDWWQRRAAVEPLSTRGALGLLQAFADAGDRPGAIRYAQVYRHLLHDELGTEPDEKVLALVEQMESAPAPVLPPLLEPTSDAGPGRGEPPNPAVPVRRRWVATQFPGGVLAGCFAFAAGAVAAPVIWDFTGSSLRSASATPAPLRPEPPAASLGTSNALSNPSARAVEPVAHELYLRGRIAWNRRSREGLETAVVLFRQATERDPTYAAAYAGMADAYVILGYLGYVSGEATFPKAKAAALQALALEPTIGQAYAALGQALQWEKQWTESEEAFIRGIEYAPEYATGHQWYALLLSILDRPQEAVTHARRAAELDPLSIQIHNTYGVMLYNAGDLSAALDVYDRIVTSEPDTAWVRQNPWVLSNFGKVLVAAGRHGAAVHLIEQAARTVPRHPRPLFELAMAYHAVGDSAGARASFGGADPQHPHYPVYNALLHARVGDMDAAFAWLGRVHEWSPVSLLTLSSHPEMVDLRADPRYPVLRKRIGL